MIPPARCDPCGFHCCMPAVWGNTVLCVLGFFQGKNNLARVPLLYLTAVVWGVAYLVLVYVFYAKSSSFVENFFAVIGGASTLLALFYLCKLLAGDG